MDKIRKQLNIRLYAEDEANLKLLAEYYMMGYSEIIRMMLNQKAAEARRRLESQRQRSAEFNEWFEKEVKEQEKSE